MGKKPTGTDGTRWAFMKVFNIPDAIEPDKTYLRRWRVIQTPWFAIYLHKIFLPDRDRPMHDHPFNFWSLILKGGYEERVNRTVWQAELGWENMVITNSWRAWSWHKMSIIDCHNIDRLYESPTWSLVFVGRRQKDWGFVVPGEGWVQHKEYLTKVGL